MAYSGLKIRGMYFAYFLLAFHEITSFQVYKML